MAKGYRPVARDQQFLLPPDMRDWLPADHPVWLVIDVVAGHLDTSAFHAARRLGGAGAAGFDPDMLVTLLAWAYANRVTSSRRIEQLCRTDVAFRVICGGDVPDHVTVARFRAGFGDAVGALFGQVLVLCAGLGMGRLGVVALDGTKVAASASKAANRTGAGLRKLAAGLAGEHAATDAAEDEALGPGVRGDEVPAGVASPRSRAAAADRAARIARALAGLEAGREAAEAERAGQDARARAYLEALAAGAGPLGPPPAGAEVAAARARLERAEAGQAAKVAAWEARRAAEDAAGIRRGPGGRKPFPPGAHFQVARARKVLAGAEARQARRERKQAAGKGPGPVRNVTDPDSRLMKTRAGFIQAYNAQNVTSEDGLVIAAELTDDPTDMAWFEPMMSRAEEAARLITSHQPPSARPATGGGQDHQAEPGPGGGDGRNGTGGEDLIGLALTDAGYCSEQNLTCAGPDRLIATGRHRDLEKAARGRGQAGTTHAGEAAAAMTARLKTEEGIAAYRHRGHIAETPHGHIKHNMGFRQLTMRGKDKAAAEWRFACTVHNLFKAITAGHLTTQALAALTA
jgi:transposase